MVVKPGGATPEVLTAACNKAWSDVAYFFKVLQLAEKDYLSMQDYSCEGILVVHPAGPVSPRLVVLDCACMSGIGSLHVPSPCCGNASSSAAACDVRWLVLLCIVIKHALASLRIVHRMRRQSLQCLSRQRGLAGTTPM